MIRYFSILFLVVVALNLKAQENISLEKQITLSQIPEHSKYSSEAIIAKHEFLSSYYSYENIRKSSFPELSLDGILPNFNRAISKITLPDGTESFVSQFYADYSANLQLSQNIPFTGGQLILKSGLERMDMFGDNRSTSFLSTPVQIGYSQPLFSFNALKWNLKINPVRYSLAKQKYIETIEKVSLRAIQLYFDLLLEQSRLQNAIQNKLYTDTLLYFAKQSYEAGKKVETEYLQIELNNLQSTLIVENFTNNWRYAILRLKQYLQLAEEDTWVLSIPSYIFNKEISVQIAQIYALENPIYQDFKVREIEAKSSVVKAQTENRINANLYAAYGLTQNSRQFEDAYNNPMDKEIVSIGLKVPIWDWGKAKNNVKIAESKQEIVNVQITKEQQAFEQELIQKVLQFNTQKTQVELSKRALNIAEKRLQVQKESYSLGKSSFTDLSNSIIDKDNAILIHLESLKNYWVLFYEIRQITLYDFEKEKKIDLDFECLIKNH